MSQLLTFTIFRKCLRIYEICLKTHTEHNNNVFLMVLLNQILHIIFCMFYYNAIHQQHRLQITSEVFSYF